MSLTPLTSLDEARRIGPSGPRARALRRAAEALGDRLRSGAIARRVEVLALERVPCATELALDGAFTLPLEWVTLERRMLYLELELEAGVRRVVVDPVEAGAWRRTPWGAWFVEAHPWRARRLGQGRNVVDALASIGVEPSSIDLAIVTHLRGQDLRGTIGTARGDGLEARRASVLPSATWLVSAKEWAATEEAHEDERPWLVRGGLERVDEQKLLRVEGDLSLGTGAALISTPGYTEGHCTLFVRTRDGALAWTSHGVAIDSWSPYHSRLPGLRARVRERDAECIPRADAVSRRETLTWMAVERAVTDRGKDPAFHLIAPQQKLMFPGTA